MPIVVPQLSGFSCSAGLAGIRLFARAAHHPSPVNLQTTPIYGNASACADNPTQNRIVASRARHCVLQPTPRRKAIFCLTGSPDCKPREECLLIRTQHDSASDARPNQLQHSYLLSRNHSQDLFLCFMLYCIRLSARPSHPHASQVSSTCWAFP